MGAEQSSVCSRRPRQPTQAEIDEHCGPRVADARKDVEALRAEIDQLKQELAKCKGDKTQLRETVQHAEGTLQALEEHLGVIGKLAKRSKRKMDPEVEAAVDAVEQHRHDRMYATLGGGGRLLF